MATQDRTPRRRGQRRLAAGRHPDARRADRRSARRGAGNIRGLARPVGAVDITLYRDDLGQADRWPVLRGTEIPFDVDGAEIVLVDDVLFTGRTVRAALNAVCDLGRPARVRLAVLVDRGHRELPIQPDVVGLAVATDRDDHVRVRLQPVDPVDEIVRIGRRTAELPSDQPSPRRSGCAEP